MIQRQGAQGLRRKAHHRQGLLERHMGCSAGQHHRIGAGLKAFLLASAHQRHQVAEAAATGGHTAGIWAKANAIGQPAAQLPFQAGERGRELFSQQIVVEARGHQISHHGDRQGRRIQVG